MRVLELIGGGKLTGATAAALAAARALAARGHQVAWLCPADSPAAEAARAAGLELPGGVEDSSSGRRSRLARRVRELAAGAGVVHVHRSREHLAALAALGFRRRRRPLARTCHAGRPGGMGVLARWLAGRAEALAVRSRALAFELGAGGRGRRVTVIPGGVDAAVFHPGVDGAAARAALGLEGRVVAGTVSRLKPGRRLLALLQAAERLAGRRELERLAFLIIGRGELRAPLERWVRGKKLAERVKFHDPGEGFAAAVAALDLGVLLVPGSDGSARAALEMAALGKPLVAGRLGALVDLVGGEGEGDAGADGACGRLVRPDSPGEIAAAIAELAADGELRRRLGAAARARVERDYTLERLGERYEAFLAPLAAPAGA